MVKVIKKPERDELKRVQCCNCGNELEYEHNDVYEGAYGAAYVLCSECGGEVMLDDVDRPSLTIKTVRWPKHFRFPSDDTVSIENSKLQQWIDEGLQCLKNSDEDSDYIYFGFGDTMVFVFKNSDEYNIYVTSDYAETYIPR